MSCFIEFEENTDLTELYLVGNALKEIELLNRLNHRNIVAFMGTVVHEGSLNLIVDCFLQLTFRKSLQELYILYWNTSMVEHWNNL